MLQLLWGLNTVESESERELFDAPHVLVLIETYL